MRFVNPALLNSLRLKILLAYVAGTAFSIALVVLGALVANDTDLLAKMDMSDAAEGIATDLVFDRDGKPIGFDASTDDVIWFYNTPQRESAYRILDSAGNVVLISSAGASFWPDESSLRKLSRVQFEYVKDGLTFYGATAPVERDGKTWYLQFATSARMMHLMHDYIALPLLGVGTTTFSIVLLISFGICGYVTLRYTLRPLQEVSASAAAISPRSMHARLKVESVPSEIAPLVDSFNHALARLEQGYRVQQEFLATAAHELKTPLALIRAQIELQAEGDERRALLNDVAHMTRQVQQLLHLAEASEVQSYQFKTIDVRAVATEAAEFLKRKADGAKVNLVLVPDNSAPVQWLADHGALFTLLKNLLENAIEHAPPGTDVRLEITSASMSVRDNGPGVSEQNLPKLFNRFWRGADRRDHGAGLGLAICKEISLAHDWALTAELARPGMHFRLATRRTTVPTGMDYDTEPA
jgi:two-component system, OmpR family, sensor histidine kinase QseC